MNSIEMHRRTPDPNAVVKHSRLILTLVSVVAFSLFLATEANAQHGFSRTYPARKNIRLDISNRTGSITVTGWERNEIKVTARIESPAARVVPEMNDDGLMIDVMGANRGRGDVGSVNFDVRVPYNSTVDIETLMGNISISDLRGQSVRASVTSSGDINLTGIQAATVMAENTSGQILFDGELLSGGTYKFSTVDGDINIRIPNDSDFRLSATAPTSRRIMLGTFSNTSLSFLGEGRKVVGNVGGGRASLTISNQRGSISFIPR